MENLSRRAAAVNRFIFAGFIAVIFLVYFFGNPEPQHYYDYTFRIAERMLDGAVALDELPPSWLNEFVPYDGRWYSVFPLGSVVSMLPFALLKAAGAIDAMPSALIAGLTAAGSAAFLLLIAAHYELERNKRLLIAAGITCGTWMWTNLVLAGAWQLALGWAMLGELGAIYFTVFRRRPLLAGLFFALAFGNRTEILLTAPLFFWLLWRFGEDGEKGGKREGEKGRKGEGEKRRKGEEETGFEAEDLDFEPKIEDQRPKTEDRRPKPGFSIANDKSQIANIALFCAVPFVLGVATLVYNFVRFDSFVDFGYARIPGVLDEPWYRHGIFSLSYIPLNIREMLYTPWKRVAGYPYFVPNGFGGSIWWSSPFILFALRRGARDRALKYTAWAAIFLLTFLLWIHGNPGGWQFGYRYAMILLPWLYLILLESSPRRLTPLEIFAYTLSIVVNAYATYLFCWTDYVKP